MQGAGSLLLAPIDQAWPDSISDIVITAAGVTKFDPEDDWFYVGFTKTGINVVRNNAEEDFTVDQVDGPIQSRPTSWEMSVGTQLAEATLETFALAWELGTIATVGVAPASERHVGLGTPKSYTQRRAAVLYEYPDGVVRAVVFRRCQCQPQEAGFTLQQTGEQVSLPMRWRALADSSAPLDSRFGEIMESIITP